ncbi:MAG TPA: glycosyltransferase [Acidobacteriaceae bacterium]|nr:glycosyltransferase [Acidobacteriaceae bacterium]HUB00584.1 glycosyltransferase [Terracidiphilus sp.]
MKFLHTIPSVDPASGGLVEGMRQLCDIMEAAGHACEVATLDAPSLANQYGIPGKTTAWGPGRGAYGYTPRAVPWIRAHSSRFDAVIVHGIWQHNAAATYSGLRGTGTPYAVFCHGMLDPYFKRQFPLKHLKKTVYWHALLSKAMHGAAAVLFTCEEEMLLARQSFRPYRVNEVIVPLGTMGPPGDAQQAAEEFLTRWPELRGKRLALFLGRIHPKKAVDVLIEAFAGTLAGDSSWRLVIAGPDRVGWERELKGLAARLGMRDRIAWTGMLTGDLKWGAYAASEVFVLPSHQENFGFVFAEALSCGLPVLLSNKVNIWREIEADRAGMVADDTLGGTQASLRRWQELGAAEMAAFRLRARKCFDERFNFQATSGRALQIFEGLARLNPRCASSHMGSEEIKERRAGASGF